MGRSGVTIALTPRLRLRTWVGDDDDLDAAARLWGDPEVMAHMAGGHAATREALRAELERQKASQRDDGVQSWAVELLSTGAVIGACGLSVFGPGPTYELTFKLARPFWGQGYAEEAAGAALAHVFGVLGAVKVVAGTVGERPATDRLLRRLGFTPRGTLVWSDTGREDPYYELLAPQGSGSPTPVPKPCS